MHHSIILSGTQIATDRCTSCCRLYHCPLCPAFKPTKFNRIQSHLKVHVKNAISFEDKKICRCSQMCRTTAHFHCPVCHKTVLKKRDMVGHLVACPGKVLQTPSPAAETTSDPDLSPSTPAPLDISTEQASFSVQQSPATSPSPMLPKTLLQKKKTKCPQCSLLLYKKNISKHIQRKHAKKSKDVAPLQPQEHHFDPNRDVDPCGSHCEAITNCDNVRPCRTSWTLGTHPAQKQLLEYVLDIEKPETELIVQTQKACLTRADFWTLGLNNEMESTIGNACFELIQKIARSKGRNIFVADLYAVVTWRQPTACDPLLSLPDDVSMRDYVVIPIWKPGHFVLSKPLPVNKSWDMDREGWSRHRGFS